MKEPILEMRGITKKFGSVTANKDVDLTLYPGAVSYTHLTLPTTPYV